MDTKHKALLTVATGALILAAATSAIAEGTWSSYLSGVGVGFSSRTWIDYGLDQVPTSVKLSGCSMNTSGTFSSTHLNLFREYGIFPDISQGSIANTCNTVSWGSVGADYYHFTIEKINGSTGSSPRFSATSIVTNY